jgi:hypothetical protein
MPIRPSGPAAALVVLAGSAQALAAGPFPASIELTTLDGTNGFVLEGIDPSDYAGASVSAAGDVNGDGIDDLIIGAYAADPGANNLAGESYVVFGKATGFESSFRLSTLDGTNGFVLKGIDAFDSSGGSVSCAGDINGDGIDDLIIGAGQASPNEQFFAGESYVVLGKATGFAASLDLSSLNGTDGFVINGISALDRSGLSVSSAGDVNDDGIDDLIIGAPYASPDDTFLTEQAGETYVVFGRGIPFTATLNLATLDGTNGFTLNGALPFDQSGWSVSSAGDVNGDGIDDLIIGARYASPVVNQSFQSIAGKSYVVFGKATPFTASLDLANVDGTNGFVINGIDVGDQSGYSVSSAGDINGDGIGDLIIGAPGAGPSERTYVGESYVVFGKTTEFAASLNLATLDGTNGFVIKGIDAEDFCGRSISSAGDVNGDGIDDIIIGALLADQNGQPRAGESYVVFGRTSGFMASLNLSSLDGTNGFLVKGIDNDDLSGYPVSSAGDINGDGVDDLIIGARQADPSGRVNAGETYVVFGRKNPQAHLIAVGIDDENSKRVRGDLSAQSIATSLFQMYDLDAIQVFGRRDSQGGFEFWDGEVRPAIEALLASQGGPLGPGDTFVFSFSGHGTWTSGVSDPPYESPIFSYIPMLPNLYDPTTWLTNVNAGNELIDLGDSFLLSDDVLTNLFKTPEWDQINKLFIIDACFGGGFWGDTAATDRGDLAQLPRSAVIGAASERTFSWSWVGSGESYFSIGLREAQAAGRRPTSISSLVDEIDSFAAWFVEPAGAGEFPLGLLMTPLDFGAYYAQDMYLDADLMSAQSADFEFVVGSSATPTCLGDVNGDGATDIFDFADLANAFGSTDNPPFANGDLDGDRDVDIFDFADFADDFGCGTP